MAHTSSQMNKLYNSTTVGVCGLMGAGKSAVLQLLDTRYKIPCFDCDTVAKQAYFEPDIRSKTKEILGFDPLYNNGSAIRSVEIGRAIATSKQRKQAIEQLIHRAVDRRIDQWRAEHCHSRVIAIESAILFTANLRNICDYVFAVTADKEIRKARVEARDKEKADAGRFERIDTLQIQEHTHILEAIEKDPKVLQLHNNGTPEELDKQLFLLLGMVAEKTR